MSGHSKWHKIKGAKGAADAKRGAVFTKLSRAIAVAAREGGADISMNFKLRIAIDTAKSQNMPKDTIERAIARGAGTGEEVALSEVLFEAFGPGGVALLIEAVTDNNRTSSGVRALLTKHGARLGDPGSVVWQFERKGVVRVACDSISEDLELELIEAGAEDIKEEEGGFTMQVAPDALKSVVEFLEAKNIKPEHSDLEWISKNTIALEDEDRAKLEQLIEVLENDDDIANVFSNDA